MRRLQPTPLFVVGRAEALVLREASETDIPALRRVRASVRENVLPCASLLGPDEYREHLEGIGRTWVCEADGRVVAFAAGNTEWARIWALFVEPAWERRGIGRALLETALAWLRAEGLERVSLTTRSGTRAAGFYEAAGWVQRGTAPDGDPIYEKALVPG